MTVLVRTVWVLGAAILVSWIGDIPWLSSFVPIPTRAKPQTAIALIAVGLGVSLLRGSAPHSRPSRRVASIVLFGAVGIGVLDLVRPSWWTWALGVAGPASRMAAAEIVVLAGATLLVAWSPRAWIGQLLAVLAVLGACVGISGYLFDVEAFHGTTLFAETSLPTLLGILCLGPALLLARPHEGVAALFLSASVGGVLLRRLFIPVLIAPVVVNALALLGAEANWYPERTGWMLNVGVVMGLLGAISWLAASGVHVMDQRREVAANALREAEERYRALVEASPDAIIVKNRKRIEFVNLAAVALLGAPENEVVGRSPSAFVHPDERAGVDRRLCALLTDGEPRPVAEQRLVRADGTVVEVEVTGVRITIGGAPLVQLVARDIRERKRAERELRESEERFRLLAETIPDVFWMATPSLERVLYVSPAYERVWGWSRASLYGNPAALLDTVHPDDRATVAASLQATAQTAEYVLEYRVVRPDGSIRWIRDRGYPVRDESGAVKGVVGLAQDVTDARLADEAVRREVERFHLVTRATRDAIWDMDVKTGHLWWSDYAFDHFGLDRKLPPSPNRWAERIHPDDRDRVTRGLGDVLARRENTYATEYLHRFADGQYGAVLARASILYDDTGSPSRIVGAMVDLRELRALERRLAHAEKMEAVGKLTAGIAHDFNNVLTGIIGFTEVLLAELPRAGGPATESQRRDLLEILAAAGRAAGLTRQLLAFSRQQVLAPKVVDPDAVIADAEKLLRRLLREDIDLELVLAAGADRIRVDPTQLDQVIVNLVVNAADAMPGGGRLRIATEGVEVGPQPRPLSLPADMPPGRYVRLSVTDTGRGMTAEEQLRIFEPFYTTKAPGQGTGLGLATVYGVVTQSGGYLNLSSEPRAGTTFELFFPTVDADEPPETAAPLPAAGGGRETILVTEDDPAIRRLLRQTLEHHGYRVLVAAGGEEALELARGHGGAIHLLVTDVVMPGMSGVALADRLRALHPEARVLYASGYAQDIALRAGVPRGSSFIAKPFGSPDLLVTVRHVLDQR